MPRNRNVVEPPRVLHRHRDAEAFSSVVSAADGRNVAVIAAVLKLTSDSVVRCSLLSCRGKAAVITGAEKLRADTRWPRCEERGSVP